MSTMMPVGIYRVTFKPESGLPNVTVPKMLRPMIKDGFIHFRRAPGDPDADTIMRPDGQVVMDYKAWSQVAVVALYSTDVIAAIELVEEVD